MWRYGTKHWIFRIFILLLPNLIHSDAKTETTTTSCDNTEMFVSYCCNWNQESGGHEVEEANLAWCNEQSATCSCGPPATPSPLPTTSPTVSPIDACPVGIHENYQNLCCNEVASSDPKNAGFCAANPSCTCSTPDSTVLPTSSPNDAPTIGPSNSPTVTVTSCPESIRVKFMLFCCADTITDENIMFCAGNANCGCMSPTQGPSDGPTVNPTPIPTPTPSDIPTLVPSDLPTAIPSELPSNHPSVSPTQDPTRVPTAIPSDLPSGHPTVIPSLSPAANPTRLPTPIPSDHPTAIPSDLPTPSPSDDPTRLPTAMPSGFPTAIPSDLPTPSPSDYPTSIPSDIPTRSPSENPTPIPSDVPTPSPTDYPTAIPSDIPTAVPSDQPTPTPSDYPTAIPTPIPSDLPTGFPTHRPTVPCSHDFIEHCCDDDSRCRQMNPACCEPEGQCRLWAQERVLMRDLMSQNLTFLERFRECPPTSELAEDDCTFSSLEERAYMPLIPSTDYDTIQNTISSAYWRWREVTTIDEDGKSVTFGASTFCTYNHDSQLIQDSNLTGYVTFESLGDYREMANCVSSPQRFQPRHVPAAATTSWLATLLDRDTNFLSRKMCCDLTDMCHMIVWNRPTVYANFGFAAATFGDPHITTLDGVSYLFNGKGEYTLLSADVSDTSVVIQARARENGRATVWSAAVIHIENSNSRFETTVQINVNDNLTPDDKNVFSVYIGCPGCTNFEETQLSIDWDDIMADMDHTITPRDMIVQTGAVIYQNAIVTVSILSPQHIMIGTDDGIRMVSKLIVPENSPRTPFMNLMFVIADRFSSGRGLFGSTSNGYFIKRDGGLVSINATEEDIFDFGQSWAVDRDSSVFGYPSGKTCADFRDLGFTPSFGIEFSQCDDGFEQIAREECGEDEDCLYDASATCDLSIGRSTLVASMEVREMNVAMLRGETGRTNQTSQVTPAPTVTENANFFEVSGENHALIIVGVCATLMFVLLCALGLYWRRHRVNDLDVKNPDYSEYDVDFSDEYDAAVPN